MNSESFHPKWSIIVFIGAIASFTFYSVLCRYIYLGHLKFLSDFLTISVSDKPYRILSYMSLTLAIILGIYLSSCIYIKSKSKYINKNIKECVYSIIFRLITLYSIFLVGLWKISMSKVGVMPTCYFIFIYTIAFIASQLNYIEAYQVISGALDRNKNNIMLQVPKRVVNSQHGGKNIQMTIEKHSVHAHID